MLLHPAVIALVGVSLVVTALLCAAGVFAFRVLRHWDLTSGSERQLRLERSTYLVATLVTFAFVAELVTLLLFVYTAESLHPQFVGAMCATGVLNVNPWGWPALLLKVTVFFAGAVWLQLNRLDNRGYDYPLVRVKYALLLGLVPLVAASAFAQWRFFLGLEPEVITSCCGALFSPDGQGVAAELSALAPGTALAALWLGGLPAVVAAAVSLKWRRGTGWLAPASAIAFPTALAGIVSGVALYVYEHPHHHCPFCILKAGHDYVGYWLYLPLFVATAFGLGAGLLHRWRRVPSLTAAVAAETRRSAALALTGFLLFHAVAAWAIASSNLKLFADGG